VQLGFRVPMLVISRLRKRGYVDEAFAEFSALLRFVADNWDVPWACSRSRTRARSCGIAVSAR
jgi:phospholipase C